MKKIILTSFALVAALAVNAQKGSVLIGSDFSYEFEKTGENSTDKFGISPVVGYFLTDNIAVGVKTDGAFASSKIVKDAEGNEANVKSNEYKVGGFVRYNKPLNETFSIYADLGAGYQSSHTYTRGGGAVKAIGEKYTEQNKMYGYYVDLKPAISINVHNGWALNVNFGGLEWNDTKSHVRGVEEYSKVQAFDFTLGKEIGIGVTKTFKF